MLTLSEMIVFGNVIMEELSISKDVIEITNHSIKKLNEQLSKFPNGFQVIQNFYFTQCIINDKQLDGMNIEIIIDYFFVSSKKIFDIYKEDLFYKEQANSRLLSNKAVVYIKKYGYIDNGKTMTPTSIRESLQHELEHTYQMSKGY